MDFSSFITSLATSCLIFLILMFVFAWLSRRPSNYVVYYPNRILKGLEPTEKKSRNPFTWIKEALSATEADIISISGVDAAVYLIFLSTALTILVLSGLILLPILLPVAGTDKNGTKQNANGNFSDLEKLSMANIEKGSVRLWAFLGATYVVSFFTFYMLWKAYDHVTSLRAAVLSAPEVKPQQFAILVRDIPAVPEGQTRKEQVDSYFRKIHGDSFYRSMVVTNNKQANKIWKKLEGYKKKLARAEEIFATSKTTAKPEGTRPTHKTGLLGLLGPKVDTIDYCNKMISETVPKLESEQKNTLTDKQQAAAFIFFNSRLVAASAAQSIHANKVDHWTVDEAPEPRQILWSNVPMSFYQRQIRQYTVYAIVALTIFFYMIPIGFISAFTTLENLKKLLPFMKSIVDKPAIKTVLEAYLPQIALIVFLALLPMFLMILSKAEGIAALGHATRAASGKYFYFIVLNVFLGVTIGGTLFSAFKTIQKDTGQIVPMLGRNIPLNATFFLTFVALKFFVGYGLELSRLIPLIIYHLKKKFLCKTEGDVKEAWAPGGMNYATKVPNDMLIMTIVLCYSTIAPVILPFGVVYFGLGWLIFRNQLLKVYVPTYESYGRMWPHMHARILAALIIYQITMVGYFSVKKFLYTPFVIPLPILSFVFMVLCRNKFYGSFLSTPLEVVAEELKESPNMETIYKAYLPQCLRSEKFNDGQQLLDAAALSQAPNLQGGLQAAPVLASALEV